MSVSKLESLPNEILINIFEKYMNGVDIPIGFGYSRNKRFDGLISQCQRFHFNFLNCRKDYFHFCIDLLPTCIEKIEELVLSDQNTPGQIYTFLSFFPSFIAFTRLRKLYFHLNANYIDWSKTMLAIRSLSNTAIDTILIEIMNKEKELTLNYPIKDIIGLKTIKRLFLTNVIQKDQWFLLPNSSSKIEYLTNSGMSCGFQDLQYIFQCASHLKYLNIQLTSDLYYNYSFLTHPPNDNITPIPTLHTLILSFKHDDPTTFDMLAQYLRVMPALHRLEIKAHSALLDANAWQALLQTSLPLLSHFKLKTTTSCMKKDAIDNTLASFETPFWIEKKNFYMIITKHKHLDSNRFCLNKMQINDKPVIQWWVAPIRALIDDIPMNDITSCGISGMAAYLSRYYYFKNVKHLVIYNLDQTCRIYPRARPTGWGKFHSLIVEETFPLTNSGEISSLVGEIFYFNGRFCTSDPDNNLLEWLVTYVNYLRIEYLDVSLLNNESSTITSLLLSVRHITSLRIQYSCLLINQNAYLKNDNCLKYLDISVDKHSFDEKDIATISRLFHNLEHLAINTKELSNIPLLQTYLPHLCSLTFKVMDDQFSSYSIFKQQIWDYQLRQQVQFLFQRNEKWITVWIDQAVLEDSYWQKFSSNSSVINTTSKRRLSLE